MLMIKDDSYFNKSLILTAGVKKSRDVYKNFSFSFSDDNCPQNCGEPKTFESYYNYLITTAGNENKELSDIEPHDLPDIQYAELSDIEQDELPDIQCAELSDIEQDELLDIGPVENSAFGLSELRDIWENNDLDSEIKLVYPKESTNIKTESKDTHSQICESKENTEIYKTTLTGQINKEMKINSDSESDSIANPKPLTEVLPESQYSNIDYFLYRLLYSDIRNLPDENLLNHYIHCGRAEKRIICCDEILDKSKVVKKTIDMFDQKKLIFKENNNAENEKFAELDYESKCAKLSHFSLSQLVRKIIPENFSLENYKTLNKDLGSFTMEGLLRHFIYDGIMEGRSYDMSFPVDFDVRIYKKLNIELAGMTDDEASLDFLYFGRKKGLRYKYSFDPNLLPQDFDPQEYKTLNNDLNSFTDEEASAHYINHGRNENRFYTLRIKVQSEKKKLYIQAEYVYGGGVTKYCNDLLANFDKLFRDSESYSILTNNKFFRDLKLNRQVSYFIWVNNNIFDFILDKNENSKYEKIVFHINGIPNSATKSIVDLSGILHLLKDVENLEMVVTIHDFMWFDFNNQTLSIQDFTNYQMDSLTKFVIQDFFTSCKKIIFPQQSIYNMYCQKLYPIRNYLIRRHFDIVFDNASPYYSKITQDTLKLMFIGDCKKYKGFYFLIDLFRDFKFPIKINIYLTGYIYDTHIQYLKSNSKWIQYINLGVYQYKNIFNIINEIQPNLFLLLSTCFETYSYTTSVILKTGLPIFYNRESYFNRINFRHDLSCVNVINVFPFHYLHDLTCLHKNLTNVLRKIVNENLQDFRPVHENFELQLENRNDIYFDFIK